MALLVFYIVLGCFLDGISSVVLTMAVVEPMIRQAGIDIIWFGIFIVVVVEMAQITPPIGFNLFVLQGMTGHEMNFIARAAFPMFLIMVVMVFVLIAFPDLATWLPEQHARSVPAADGGPIFSPISDLALAAGRGHPRDRLRCGDRPGRTRHGLRADGGAAARADRSAARAGADALSRHGHGGLGRLARAGRNQSGPRSESASSAASPASPRQRRSSQALPTASTFMLVFGLMIALAVLLSVGRLAAGVHRARPGRHVGRFPA